MNVEWQRRPFGPPLLRFLHRWLVTTVAVMVAANIVPGIEFYNWQALLVASLVLGVLNALLRPLLLILSLPIVVLSLGLFVLVVNAVLLAFVAQLVKGFQVSGFWAAFFGGLIISLTTLILNTVTGGGQTRIDLSETRRRRPPPHDPPPTPPPAGQGPVIDV